MSLQIRALDASDAEASRTLGWEAFGTPAARPTEPATLATPGRQFWGAFDGDRLAARVAVRDYDSWFGGREVRTAGIASVTVAMEDRGRGALGPLLASALAQARHDGFAVSTLFPSAPGIYRRFGYELVSDYRTIQLPSAELARVAAPVRAVSLRRATAADTDAIATVYATWAAAQNGPLTRRGASFPDSYLDDFDAVTLAVDEAGSVVGFASWDRGQGYGRTATLEVSDLLAVSADGYRALLRGIGTFATITGNTKIDTSGEDLARLFLPSMTWETTGSDPYMLAVLDVVAALTARSYSTALEVDLAFTVRGHVLPEVDGTYRLVVRGGSGACERGAPGGEPELAPRGLAVLYAGVQSCANLRTAGLLSGPRTYDEALDVVFTGRPFHIRNYF